MHHPMLRSLLSVLVAASPLVPAAASESQQLRLVSTVWPPFTDVADRPHRASDLVHEALRRAGVVAETSIVADDRLIPSLGDGSYAGSAALWYSADRESFLRYSEPYMETRLVLVGRKGEDVSAASLSELAGKRVALVKTWAYGKAVEEARSTVFVRGDSMEDNLRAVLDGTVDYTIIDDLVIRYIVEQYQEDARSRLAIGTTPLVVRPLHFALRRDVPGAREIVERFNAEIRGMLGDGSYNRILGMTWIEADVDGDGQSELVLGGDRAGPKPPADAYKVVSTTVSETEEGKDEKDKKDKEAAPGKPRFLIGRELYKDWESVPDQYKLEPAIRADDKGGAAEPLFKIKW